MHIAKAGEENLEIKEKEVLPDPYDDHALHINEHTRYLLSAEFKRSKNREELKKRFTAHLEAHKKMQKAEGESAEK